MEMKDFSRHVKTRKKRTQRIIGMVPSPAWALKYKEMGSCVHRMCLGLAVFAAGLFSSGLAGAAEYVVQPGDTLSEIAHQQFSGPVYGKDGSLRALAQTNRISELNKIDAGQILI
jgi:hypothetical protein